MIPGLKVVAAATPGDVDRATAAAVRDPDPGTSFEHRSLYATGRGPDGEMSTGWEAPGSSAARGRDAPSRGR